MLIKVSAPAGPKRSEIRELVDIFRGPASSMSRAGIDDRESPDEKAR